MHVSEFERCESLQEDRESKCISAEPLKRHSTDWGALWGRHWGFMQLLSSGTKQALHTMQEMTLPLSAHTFLRPAASSPLAASTEWKRSYFKKKKLFIRVLRNKWSGALWGWVGGSAYHWMWMSLITLHYHWAGFLLLGPSPGDTPQCFHGLQVTKVWSEQWKARTSLGLRVWCLRRYSSARKGLTYQGSVNVQGGCDHVRKWAMESELRVWHQLRGLGSSSGDKTSIFPLG